MKRTPEQHSWIAMRMRCTNPNQYGYRWYGARGIKVCERWDSFENFLADMGPRPSGYTLGRNDHDGDYEPANCRWVPRSENASEPRRRPGAGRAAALGRKQVKWLTHNGRTLCAADWADELGIPRTTFYRKLKEGAAWPFRS